MQLRTYSYMSWVSARTQSTLKRSPANVKTFWLESHRQARSDFRARAGRGCWWVLVFIWFAGLTAGFVVGRGGQGLLALLSWKTFVQYVTTSMEIQPVTFDTYRIIFLQNESLILAIPRIIRDFSRRRGLHSRFAMVFIVLTMLFVLVFPTLGSAMTGYSGNVEAYVPDSAGNNILFSSFRPLYYVIHDGSRLNLTDEYEVLATQEDDVGLYRTSRDTKSTFAGVGIDSPLLNITSYHSDWQPSTYSMMPQLNHSIWLNASGPAVDEAYPRSWTASGEHFDLTSVATTGVCQATKDYQWGFSFIQLALMMLLLWLWTLGTTTLHTISTLRLKQQHRTSVAGEYKAVFELADAMHVQLSSTSDETATDDAMDPRQLSESSLRQRIKSDLHGGAIAYDDAVPPPDDERKTCTFRAWVRREVWWLLALAVCTTLSIFSIYTFIRSGRIDLFVFFALPLALGFAMHVGTTQGSRGMVLGWTVGVVCVGPAIVLVVALLMVRTASW
ncbi:hypothetical protein N0V95_001628 [Ascochyta clinopodiicola]|nr:hypothetical protein N0V95_001628 [Ascochyta clinopodiicola]